MGEDLSARGQLAALAYLERAGFTLLDITYVTIHGTIPIVAIDGDELVYVRVRVHKDKAFTPPTASAIRMYHKRMAQYQEDQGLHRPVRIDTVDIRVITEDRALLRHHRDVRRAS